MKPIAILVCALAAIAAATFTSARASTIYPYSTASSWAAEVWPRGEAPWTLGYWSKEDRCRQAASEAAIDGALWRCRRVLRV